MKVAKFGGSSLSCREQFEKVKKIVTSDPERDIVVVSALGRRSTDDAKITDLLYILHAHLQHSVDYQEIFAQIAQRFLAVKEQLALTTPIEDYLREIQQNLQHGGVSLAYLVSRGEFLTARLVSDFLGYEFIDATEVIKFQYDGQVDFPASQSAIAAILKISPKIVVPGFYGAYPNNELLLMSRGGSDVTGAILARAANCQVYENWTDVDGIALADPRIIDQPKIMPQLTYQELQELSFMGANVLHTEAISPVQLADIPLQIKNTNAPEKPGTTITKEVTNSLYPISGITGKQHYLSLLMTKHGMIQEVGFLSRMMEIFKLHYISIEYVLSGYNNVRVVFNQEAVALNLYQVLEELKAELKLDSIELSRTLSLIAVVGRSQNQPTDLSSQVFAILGKSKINVTMISQSSHDLNLIIGVEDQSYQQAIDVLYQGLIKE